MARERPVVQSFTADGPILTAILDVLGDLHDLIDERLPSRADTTGKGPVRVSEPAADLPPAKAVPVAEPPPDEVEDDEEEVEPVSEPVADLPEPPPRAGKGSGLEAWQVFAGAAGVGYDPDDRRDDIIAACELAEVIPEG